MNYEILSINNDDSDYIEERIVEFNLEKMPVDCNGERAVHWFGKKITDDSGKIIAGCVAMRTAWKTAEVSVLWVDEACRKHGLGSQVLGAVAVGVARQRQG